MPIWNILVLDKSASMRSQKYTLINEYNKLVKEQIEQGSQDKFTVIGFNSEVNILKDERFPNVSIMEEKDFDTDGCTALLDAIGAVYDIILGDTEYDDITITVITDGMENSSKIFTSESLNEIRMEIDRHYNINFLFIGSDISCLQNNVLMNHVSHSINYDGDISLAIRTASRTMSSQRDGLDFVPEGVVNVTPCESLNEQLNLVSFKRQHSSVEPPHVSRCEKLCRLN